MVDLEVTAAQVGAIARHLAIDPEHKEASRESLRRLVLARTAFVTEENAVLDGPRFLRAKALVQAALLAVDADDAVGAFRELHALSQLLGSELRLRETSDHHA
jgi:hypothetical protein